MAGGHAVSDWGSVVRSRERHPGVPGQESHHPRVPRLHRSGGKLCLRCSAVSGVYRELSCRCSSFSVHFHSNSKQYRTVRNRVYVDEFLVDSASVTYLVHYMLLFHSSYY